MMPVKKSVFMILVYKNYEMFSKKSAWNVQIRMFWSSVPRDLTIFCFSSSKKSKLILLFQQKQFLSCYEKIIIVGPKLVTICYRYKIKLGIWTRNVVKSGLLFLSKKVRNIEIHIKNESLNLSKICFFFKYHCTVVNSFCNLTFLLSKTISHWNQFKYVKSTELDWNNGKVTACFLNSCFP